MTLMTHKLKKSPLRRKTILPIGRFEIPCRIYENDGPALICINGVQQSMAMWLSFVERFCEEYRIVLFDFPNQGKARILTGPSKVSLDEQVEILKEVMEAAGLDRDTIISAASWGGVVATAFAAKYPHRLKRLNLASLGTRPNRKMVETIRKGAQMRMDERDKMAQTLIDSFGQALPAQMKQEVMHQFRWMKKENIQAFYEHGISVITSKQLNEIVNLSAIRAPTTILHGEKDKIIDFDDVRFLASLIPDCELRVLKDVGHFMHMENDDVLEIYAEVLRLE